MLESIHTHTGARIHARATLCCFQCACRELKREGEIRKAGRETVSHGASLEASVLDRVVSTLAAPPAEPERVRGTDRHADTYRKKRRERKRTRLLAFSFSAAAERECLRDARGTTDRRVQRRGKKKVATKINRGSL